MKVLKRNLTPKQEQAIIALLNETTTKAAAESVGVTEVTLHRWLKQPLFLETFRTARREAVEKATALIQNSTWAAATTLVRLLGSGSDSVKLRAAQAILDQALKGLEIMDFEERLIAVEEFAKEMGEHK